MNQIARIIFDILASGRGINLPGVGSLGIERESAKFISRYEITPPLNKVTFSPDQNPAYVSVVDTLSERNGIDGKEAKKMYEEWLKGAGAEMKVVEINEVGVLKNDHFYPSATLYDMLNPAGQEVVSVKKKSSFWKKYFIIFGIIIGILLIVALVIRLNRDGKFALPKKHAVEQTAAVEMTDTKVESDEVPVEDLIQKELESYARQETAATQGLPVYHLVAGVFAEPANADKLIARDRLGVGSAAYTKLNLPNGRVMVSAFSSTDKSQVENKRRDLYWQEPELWIHEEK